MNLSESFSESLVRSEHELLQQLDGRVVLAERRTQRRVFLLFTALLCDARGGIRLFTQTPLRVLSLFLN